MKVVYLISVLALAAYCEAFGDGAPASACKDMIPRHPVDPQDPPAPYTITTNKKIVKAGTQLHVTISGKEAKDTIKGIILQARVEGSEDAVGTFTVDPNDPLIRLSNCGTPGDTVTHKRHPAEDDKQTITVIWNPPADFNDIVKFRATIALNGAVFWVGLESAPIKVIQ